ncbi:MAG: type I-E CRISPR-associated protein Cse2/CasB [Treponema sp.]|jgi:CRISPR system Cascade subunit CasB|nr:type I-E CRISPR-associated protein Cse2/CasB [Treponema sp.]
MDTNKNANSEGFVAMVIKGLDKEKPNTAMRAALRQADNPATAFRSWEYLSYWCNIQKDRELKAFALIGASMARARKVPEAKGGWRIGQALAQYYSQRKQNNNREDDSDTEDKIKLRRLLACKTTQEACVILRPVLRLITADEAIHLDYVTLLKDLIYFNERTKVRWARDFYDHYHKKEEA